MIISSLGSFMGDTYSVVGSTADYFIAAAKYIRSIKKQSDIHLQARREQTTVHTAGINVRATDRNKQVIYLLHGPE
jgi:hypothetical protein